MVHTLIWFLHLAAAVSALAAAVHFLARLRAQKRLGERAYRGELNAHARNLALFYTAAVAFGALIYPPFRYDVRHVYLDDAHPHLTGLFEIKEHLAALGLLPAIAIYVLVRLTAWTSGGARPMYPVLTVLGIFVLGVLLYNTLFGWYLASEHPI